MKNTIYIWKAVGLTPLEIVEKFKEKNPQFKNEIISYAGRLDPMAEGILILLAGDENKKRNKYLALKKEYESEIVLGISTDTFDSLGLIIDLSNKEISEHMIARQLKTFIGKQKQLYPPYSSKAINGKPLFWWARNEKMKEIKIPERSIEIYSIELLNFEKVYSEKLIEKIIENIKKIKGDFRQEEIIKSWEKFAKQNKEKELVKIKIRINCSSGTYIRRVADDLGKRLNTGAFAYTIMRIGIGNIKEKDCLKID